MLDKEFQLPETSAAAALRVQPFKTSLACSLLKEISKTSLKLGLIIF